MKTQRCAPRFPYFLKWNAGTILIIRHLSLISPLQTFHFAIFNIYFKCVQFSAFNSKMHLGREYTVGYLGPVTVWMLWLRRHLRGNDEEFRSLSKMDYQTLAFLQTKGKLCLYHLFHWPLMLFLEDTSFRCDFSCSFHFMFYTVIDKTIKSVQFPVTGFSHVLMTITTRGFRNTPFLFQKQIWENRGAAKLGQRSTEPEVLAVTVGSSWQIRKNTKAQSMEWSLPVHSSCNQTSFKLPPDHPG